MSDRFYAELVDGIADGTFVAGTRLPSVRVMSRQRGVGRDTVLRVYDRLVAANLVRAVRGSGYFVNDAHPPTTTMLPPDRRDALDPMRLVHSDYAFDRQPGSGLLRHDSSAQAEVSRALRSVVAGSADADGGYGDPLGYLPLRRQLCDRLRHGGIDVAVDSVVTVPGAVAGLSLAIRATLRPGSMALMEDPCSFIHMHALMAQGADIRRIPRLADGPDLDILREICERYRPKVFVLSSLLHNPTGTSIALYKAQQLVEIATEFDMVLIDDCSYADLLPRPGDVPAVPLILLDRLRSVVHVGGFSRTVSPAAGPGYVVAGETQMRYVRAYRPVAGLGNLIVAERTVYRLLSDGLYRRRCDRVQARLTGRALDLRHRLGSIGLSLPPPRPGMFLWLSLGDGVDSGAVASGMLKREFLTAPAKHFTSTPEARGHMRFNVTTTTERAIEALSACL